MKKERFKEIVSNYTSTPDEIDSLKKLANDYPFSQIIHLLLANSSKKNNSQEFKPSLRNAAFHSTDRSILKSLIENNLIPGDKNIPLSTPSETINKPVPVNKKISIDTSQQISSLIDSGKLAESVLENLEKLQKIKKEASAWLDVKTTPVKQNKKPSENKIKTKPKIKKKISRPKSQNKIIEEFIKEEPRITKNTKPANEKQDMSKESVIMREDVISESLAKIFVKQGKNEKAIDIYKKLIWKFPQKKALFAAQIEKLKKK